ncbi:MAG: prolyl oligopeptidase family serine peptidase [Planctomycetota bacterium]
MSARLLALALAVAACSAPPANETVAAPVVPRDALTIDRLLARPSLTGTSPSSPAWSPDSRRLAFLWSDSGASRREVWLVERDGADLRRLTGESEDASSVSGFAWLPDARGVVYLRSGSLWRSTIAGESTRLTSAAGSASSLAISPDGRFASFLRDGDLWLFEIATGTLTQATDVGEPSISSLPIGRYSRPEVEIGAYVWGGPRYAWSPDGRSVAVHHVDRRQMRTVPFPDYLGDETNPNAVRRGYPGDPNEARRVGILRVETRELQFLDLPDPTGVRVVDFDWSADGRLLVDRESDVAVDRWLHVFDPETNELREIWSDRRESRVYTLAGSAWHPDGEHVVFVSDAEDRYGLYLWGPELDAPRRLTSSAFDVTSPPRPSASGAIDFQSNEPSPYERHVFRLPADGGPPVRLTGLAGENRGYPSPDGASVALLHSDDRSPTELYLVDVESGGAEQRITHSTPSEFEQRAWARVRYETFESRVDGATLHARILEPHDLDPSMRYPVIFGPVYSNTVRNRWGGRWGLLQQLLVDRGAIVVQVDVRGSTGYGRAFREGFLMDFAGKDLEDLASVAEAMKALPYTDPDRFGIWGSSYGGTLTVYALLKMPGLFHAGVAGAAAVDPRFFGTDDVAIVRRPESHPDAFARGAAQYAGNLEDHLLIIHGMQDQVVPFKTTVALAEELMRQGKDFDFAFAPAGTHGWAGPPHYARYLYGKLLQHFERYLWGSTPGD